MTYVHNIILDPIRSQWVKTGRNNDEIFRTSQRCNTTQLTVRGGRQQQQVKHTTRIMKGLVCGAKRRMIDNL
jgi:hypothetical protein